MRYKGVPVDEWVLPKGKVGHTLAFEEALARRWAGETIDSYKRLSPIERAQIVAAYRSQMLLDAIIADQHSKAIKRLQARGRANQSSD